MKRVFKIILILAVFACVLFLADRLTAPKYAETLVEGSMISQYYREEKDHEVIFIGDCEVYANFSPMVLYEEAGIKAYVRGSSQQLLWQSYYILKETLRYEKPKVVVFNVNAMRYDHSSDEVNEAYNRLCIDKMKWSSEKVGIIRASMKEDESFLSYVFPLLRYHSRFDELTGEDLRYLFKTKDNTYNGFLVNKNVKPLGNLPVKRVLPTYDFSKECWDYLDAMLALCRENGCGLMLIKAPSVYPYWYDEHAAQIEEYAAANGLVYVDLRPLAEEIGLDYSVDTYDGGLHLNFSGAEKNSRYFAKLLKKYYDLNDLSGDPSYDRKLEAYKAERIK